MRQCNAETGALGDKCWTAEEELEARSNALAFIFKGEVGFWRSSP